MKTEISDRVLYLTAETSLEEFALREMMQRGKVSVLNANHWENTTQVKAEIPLPDYDWGS